MKKKCLIYGNCQARAISTILQNTKLNDIYDIITPNAVHILTEQELNDIYNIIDTIDLLIIQPVSDNYRNNHKYSTKSMIESVNDKCLIIQFPVCYLNFYYPSLTFLKKENNMLSLPTPYHDKNLIDLFIKYKKKEEIVKKYKVMVKNPYYYDKKFLQNMFNESINELIKRENDIKYRSYDIDRLVRTINISDYIIKNYKKKLLFYSVNHPAEPLLFYISNKILEYLEIMLKINLTDDDYMNKILKLEFFTKNRLPLYHSLKQIVNFDLDNSKNQRIAGEKMTLYKFVAIYISIYSKKTSKEYLEHYKINVPNHKP